MLLASYLDDRYAGGSMTLFALLPVAGPGAAFGKLENYRLPDGANQYEDKGRAKLRHRKRLCQFKGCQPAEGLRQIKADVCLTLENFKPPSRRKAQGRNFLKSHESWI
ncbi:hypothetical protein KM043_002366 [Ampulex compressa]|nr:hypothetical protein KM043_002366 [Ampulex compressa]